MDLVCALPMRGSVGAEAEATSECFTLADIAGSTWNPGKAVVENSR
eukprot:CAMPEP_0115856786 /NCGR_PEP_ID=MMETSP0287-20121206/15236_1 /TAXON_ID=412157 /ORGANISM="Chrysochromulina rotalis, Strain UIO044" /LENGTH=45 /DNA_ID= /DNA_START= /DNA_END= /DNA_ORIENTATION=